MLKHTPCNNEKLGPERCSELIILALISIGAVNLSGLTVRLQLIKLPLNLSEFRAVTPCLVPVDVGVRSWCSSNSLKHPLSGVGARGTLGCAFTLEVGSHGVRVLANIAKVYSLATLGEEEESIEPLEEHS